MPEKKWRPFNHGLTLVNKVIETKLHLLFQHLHSDHFNPGIADIDDLELIVPDNDAVLQAGNGLVLVDDIAGEGFRLAIRQIQPYFLLR
jgi:hypothetical protein